MSKHELGEERQAGAFQRKEEQELARGGWSLWYETEDGEVWRQRRKATQVCSGIGT